MKKHSLILSAAVAATLASSVAVAGELSGNVGVASQYFFRGVQQTPTAAANGGLDYDFGNGASVGIWASDVGDGVTPTQGIEYDLYGSYGGEVSGFEYSAGYTLYLYTGDFDTEYGEVNLGAVVGPVAIDVAIGTHEAGAVDQDYSFVSLSGDVGPISVLVGSWGGDFSGSYIELGMSTDIGGADAGITLFNSDPDGTDITTDGTVLLFSLSKGFEL